MKFVLKEIWDLGNLLPKLSRNPKIKSQDKTSRRQRPDGRTRGSHAPKRVAICHYQAAETRPKPHFRGNPVLSRDQFSWESCVGTLPPSAPINTPAVQPRSASRKVEGQIQGFLRLVVQVFFAFCNFYVSEGEGYVESDTDVCSSSLPLYQVIKVTFIFVSLLYFPFYFLFLFYFISVGL